MHYEKSEIFIPHKGGYRQYPFSFGRMINSAGVEVGSGFVPDGESVYQQGALNEEIDTPVILAPTMAPDFIERKELATGIMYNSGQW